MTISKQKIFHLSAEEVEYLLKLTSEDNSFRKLLPSSVELRADWDSLTLNHGEAELLRDHFTQRLATLGFDESYMPNSEGAILEKLIDRFFLSAEEWKAN